MANDLTNIMPKILARGLQRLRGKLVMPMLVNSDFSSEAAKKGSTIDVPIAVSQSVSDVTPSNSEPSLVDTTPDLVQIPLDQWKMTRFNLTDKEMVEIDAKAHFMPLQTESAIDAIAETVNAYLFALYKGVYSFVGTAGTTPFASNATAAINARKKLHSLKVARSPRRMVLDLDAEANALGLATYADAEKTMEDLVKIEGEIGRKYGFDHFSDQQVPTHTLAGAGTPLVNGGSQTGKTLATDGWTTKPEAGDIFTIAGDTTQYVVVSSTTLATTASTLTIEPALASSPADNAALTLVASHVVNLAFHRDAFTFASRPLLDTDMSLGTKMISMTDPLTGISLRLEVKRLHKVTVWEFDILYGGKLTRPQAATRVLG